MKSFIEQVPSFIEYVGGRYDLDTSGFFRGEKYKYDNGELSMYLSIDDVEEQWASMLSDMYIGQPIQYSRHTGYECSSKGDPRFSAFNALSADGRSIEIVYQTTVKGYPGNDWRIGKGKPPANGKSRDQLWDEYYALWKQWADDHSPWIAELRYMVALNDYVVRDSFASGVVNQARALAQYLNDHPWDGHSRLF